MFTRLLINVERVFIWAVILTIVTLSLTGVSFGQDSSTRTYTKDDFVNVDGSSLQEKLDRAEKQFRSSKQTDSYWVAYHFQARDGMNFGPFSGTFTKMAMAYVFITKIIPKA